jgi:hypothetical protein
VLVPSVVTRQTTQAAVVAVLEGILVLVDREPTAVLSQTLPELLLLQGRAVVVAVGLVTFLVVAVAVELI